MLLAAIWIAGIVLMTALVLRMWQFSVRYRRAAVYEEAATEIIFMLDFYPDSVELTDRISTTVHTYHKLKTNGVLHPRILLTAGAAMTKGRIVLHSELNCQKLEARGLPREDIIIHQGRDGRGGMDTFEEVGLACKWLHAHGYHSVFIVANPIQFFQAYYTCIFCGVFPRLVAVETHAPPSYIIGKLFQVTLLLLDPLGKNPLWSLLKWKRRTISADTY